MATIEAHPRPQPLRALDAANRSRLAAVAVKHDVKAGRITIAEALTDERSGSLTVAALLASQPRWGPFRAGKLLASLRINERKRVRELTKRQCRVIASGCGS